MEPHLSAPYRKAIRKRYSTCSRAPFKSTSNNARSRNINGALEKPKNANRSCVMNKCAASAFQAAGIIYGLRLLRAAYCDEQMGAAHKAIVTADMDRAIDSVLHANAEFCQGVREEEQQVCDGRNEVWQMMNYAIAEVIRADCAFHIALALHHGQKAAQTQGATHHD